MEKKKVLSICIAALIVASLLATPVVAGVGKKAVGRTVNGKIVEKIPQPVIISLGKGDMWGPYEFTAEELGVDVILVVVAKGMGTLAITVKDLYIPGDTVFVEATKIGIPPETAYDEGTSPDVATVSVEVLILAVTMAKTGYVACPGGFPAGYQITVTFR